MKYYTDKESVPRPVAEDRSGEKWPSAYACVFFAAAFVFAMSNRAAAEVPGCIHPGAPCWIEYNNAMTWVYATGLAWFCSFLWVLADYVVKHK